MATYDMKRRKVPRLLTDRERGCWPSGALAPSPEEFCTESATDALLPTSSGTEVIAGNVCGFFRGEGEKGLGG